MASSVTRDHHSLRRNLRLNGKYISNDGGDEGISITDGGNVTITSLGTLTNNLTVSSNTSTAGSLLRLDDNDSLTASATKSIHIIDYDKSESTASGQLSKTTALDIDMTDGATNNASGLVSLEGMQVNLSSASNQGSIYHTGLSIVATGADADKTQGIYLQTEDGGTDIKIVSSADSGDYLKISTTTHGATTIATVDDDNNEAAHLTFDIQGDTIFKGDIADGTSVEVARIDSSARSLLIASTNALQFNDTSQYISSTTTDMTIGSQRHLTIDIVGDLVHEVTGEIDFNTSTAGFTAQTATGDGTTTIDWTNGNKFHLTFAASTNEEITFGTNPSNPCNLLLKLKQPASGAGCTADWTMADATLYWVGGGTDETGEPTLSTGVNDVDIISFYFDGTNYYGVASLGFDA